MARPIQPSEQWLERVEKKLGDLIVGDDRHSIHPAPQDNLRGDLNCDGVINLLDVLPIVSIFNGVTKPCNPITADLNGNDALNKLDVVELFELPKDTLAD